MPEGYVEEFEDIKSRVTIIEAKYGELAIPPKGDKGDQGDPGDQGPAGLFGGSAELINESTSGTVQVALDALRTEVAIAKNTVVSGNKAPYATWADLVAVVPGAAMERAEVPTTDVGTHADPVTAAIVPNSGVYSATLSGTLKWKRVADYGAVTLAAIGDEVSANKAQTPLNVTTQINSAIQGIMPSLSGLTLTNALTLSIASVLAMYPPLVPVASAAIDGYSHEYVGAVPTFDPDLFPVTYPVTRQGFTEQGELTYYTDKFTVLGRKRQAHPNQGLWTASTVVTDDYLYVTDMTFGFPNQSDWLSPKPMAAWIDTDARLVGDLLEMEWVTFHRNARLGKQTVCCRVEISDGVTTLTEYIANPGETTRGVDKVTVESWKSSTNIATLVNGPITANVQVFPWIGDENSVLDSADSVDPRKFSTRHFRKDTARFNARPIAYVATTGNDATGVYSTNPATAAATPFLTPKGALNAITAAGQLAVTGGYADGLQIRVGEGEFLLESPTLPRPQHGAGIEFTRDPLVAVEDSILTFGAAAFQPRLGASGTIGAPVVTLIDGMTEGTILFRDITLKRTGISNVKGEAWATLRTQFEKIKFQNFSFASPFISSAQAYIMGMELFDAPANWSGFGLTGTGTFRLIRGLNADLNNGTLEGWLHVGNQIQRADTIAFASGEPSGSITYANEYRRPRRQWMSVNHAAAGGTIEGVVIAQNLVENCHTDSGKPTLTIASEFGHTRHVIRIYNTFTGFGQLGRSNINYTGFPGHINQNHDLNLDVGNIDCQLNVKGDWFVADPALIGNFAFVHGVGVQGNLYQFRANTDSEMPTLLGIGTKASASSTVRLDPLFVDYQGTTGTPTPTYIAGAGDGDYNLQPLSPARDIVNRALLGLGLSGQSRTASATNNAGAY